MAMATASRHLLLVKSRSGGFDSGARLVAGPLDLDALAALAAETFAEPAGLPEAGEDLFVGPGGLGWWSFIP